MGIQFVAMASSPLLPAVLASEPFSVSVVLFSQPACEFCEEARVHYLLPLIASGRSHVFVGEVRLDGRRIVAGAGSDSVSEADFARRHDVRFAPTLLFLGARGGELAPRIVGLSRDYFGAYLDARLATALLAADPAHPDATTASPPRASARTVP